MSTKKPIKKKSKTKKVNKKPELSIFKKITSKLNKFNKWQKSSIYILFTAVVLLTIHFIVEASWRPLPKVNYGVSFSKLYADELGVDWKANFTALLDDMEIRNFRLMSYWDVSEPVQGKYNFSDLTWQMDEAAKRGAKVSLGLGMRQPRWPECHKPSWFSTLSKHEREEAIINFVKVTVTQFKDHPALQSYQLENEAVNNWFGECTPEDIDQKRLQKEFEAVKSIDQKHPVYMSLSDQHGLPLNKPVPDKYGYSVYRIVWNDKTGPFRFYVTYPTPVWYHKIRGWWIKTFKDRNIFVHELQIEPWGPAATSDLTVEEQNKSMSPKQINENFQFARKIGYPDIYTWGGEWWYWRMTKFNDPSIWNTVKTEFQNTRQ